MSNPGAGANQPKNDIGAELDPTEVVKVTPHTDAGRKPVVVVDDIHLKYRVYASGKKLTRANSRVKRKGRLREVHALQGVSLVAYEGDSIGVIGTNGSGKSTLMKAISGILPIDAGIIYASSRPSFLGVGAAMIKTLSGEKNVILGGLALGMTKAEIKSKFDAIVDFAGIRDFIDLPRRPTRAEWWSVSSSPSRPHANTRFSSSTRPSPWVTKTSAAAPRLGCANWHRGPAACSWLATA